MTEVAAALIWEGDRFLICQRPAHKARGFLWEFVGGKVEPGETKAQALIRECREELDIGLSVGEEFMEVTHAYPDMTVHLTLFHASIAEGTPKLLEHQALRWITPSEIAAYDFCPADEGILRKILEEDRLKNCLLHFALPGTPVGSSVYGSGHINDTFLIRVLDEQKQLRRFLLQKLSPAAFRNPEQLMENFVRITSYLEQKIRESGGDPEREVLHLVPARDGRPYYKDPEGCFWRLLPFIEGTFSTRESSPALCEEGARAFGRFLFLLKDFPSETLTETIPDFHNTEVRLQKLEAVLEKDPIGRADSAAEEIRFVQKRRSDCSVIRDALRRRILPCRVTHNDAKLDNLLFDLTSRKAICPVDLDTVMPGVSVFDFGDLVRSGCIHRQPAEENSSEALFDLRIYEACLRGYLAGTNGVLTPSECAFLPWGARLMALELGIRYLTDYLEGDVYFRANYPKQNLDRCRLQFQLTKEMEENFEKMVDAVRDFSHQPASSDSSCADALS